MAQAASGAHSNRGSAGLPKSPILEPFNTVTMQSEAALNKEHAVKFSIVKNP
jgi:hypothetical protein